MTRNWIVRLYRSEASTEPFVTWRIENRTEHEAEKEAEADINREHPDCDWTLSADEEDAS